MAEKKTPLYSFHFDKTYRVVVKQDLNYTENALIVSATLIKYTYHRQTYTMHRMPKIKKKIFCSLHFFQRKSKCSVSQQSVKLSEDN